MAFTRSTALALACAIALVAPAIAGASATPLSPAAGATVDGSHPVFTWSTPAGEDTFGVYISNSSNTTPAGAFYDEDIVDTGILFNNEQTWAPTSPLFAGPYWWHVETEDSDFNHLYSTPPWPFTVPPTGKFLNVKLQRYPYSNELDINVTWLTNAKDSSVLVTIKRGSKTVGRLSLPWTAYAPNQSHNDIARWHRPRSVKRGAKLKLLVTLKAGTLARTVQRSAISP